MSDPGASIARGLAGLVTLASLAVAGIAAWPEAAVAPPQPVCATAVQVIEDDVERLGCGDEPALAACARLSAGDRVRLVDGACVIEHGGMRAGLKLLRGVPLDINTATAAELQLLRGIGPATAAAIIAHRSEHGPFERIEELLTVPGIGPKTLVALQPHLAVPAH